MYVISLSLRLKTPVNQLLQQMDSADIAEYMAYDLTQNEEWCKRTEQKAVLEASRKLTPEQKADAFKAAMGKS